MIEGLLAMAIGAALQVVTPLMDGMEHLVDGHLCATAAQHGTSAPSARERSVMNFPGAGGSRRSSERDGDSPSCPRVAAFGK